MGRTMAACTLAALLCGCAGSEPTVASGDLVAAVDANGALAFRLGRLELLRTAASGFLTVGEFEAQVNMQFGLFRFERSAENYTPAALVSQQWQAGALRLVYRAGENEMVVRLEPAGERSIRLTVSAAPVPASLRLDFACESGQHFLGFGEQYAGVDQRGNLVPVWTSENGLGRAPEPQLPWQGRLSDTYFPMAVLIDPRGLGLLSDSAQYQEFDLCQSRQGVFSLEVWRPAEFSLLVVAGEKPAEVVGRLNEQNGRSRLPPPWAFEPWLAAQGGQQAVEEYLQRAVQNGVPASVLWVQDWVGKLEIGSDIYELKYHWIADPELYPDLAGLIAGAHSLGFKFLGYFNPFVRPDLEHFEEGRQQGYLVRAPGGEPYTFLHSVYDVGLVDLTRPEAVAWVQSFMEQALGYGMDGWMVDYGEWLPYDALLYGGRSGADYHNLYPGDWKRANLELIERQRPDGDFVLFSRAGHTGSAAATQVHWAGDQEASFDSYDGIRTVVPAGLSLGLCGVPYFGHDIAGFSGGPSSKELFWRWTELGAFSPIMRNHDGLQRENNWNYESDADTTEMFVGYTQLHHQLKDYLYWLAQQYQQDGLPLMRHLVIDFPDDAEAVAQDYEYMLGPDFLVAPVLEDGARKRELYLPPGEWLYLWDGQLYAGGRYLEVDAPLSIIPVFYCGDQTDLPLEQQTLDKIKALP